MTLSADQLIPVLDASSLLDQVESALRRIGKKTAADQLRRMQEDAGIDAAKCWRTYKAEAGPRTGAISREYQEVTPTRFNFVLRTASASLPAGDLQRTFVMLLQKLIVPESATAPAPARQNKSHTG